MNSKEKGNAGIGSAIEYFTKIGKTVSIPLTDSQDYDLVVDFDDFLAKIQVKYTTQKAPSGNYVVALRSISGSSGKQYKTLISSSVDYLFCITEEYSRYLIPVIDIDNTNTLTLTDNIKTKYLVC